MSRVQKDMIVAPLGLDNTTYPTDLPEGKAQLIQGFLNDRKGQLRGVGQFTAASGLTNQNPLSNMTNLLAAGGFLYINAQFGIYQAQVNAGAFLTYPPSFTLNSTPLASSPGTAQMVWFEGELYYVNPNGNGRIVSSTLYTMGIANNLSLSGAVNSASPPNLTGNYQYYFTQVDSLGRESSPSNLLQYGPFAANPALSGDSVTITFPFASYNAQTTHVNLYRTTNGGSVFYLVVNLTASASHTPYVDTTQDGVIQQNAIGPNFLENEPPNPASIVTVHQNRLWMDDTSAPAQSGVILQYTNYNSATQSSGASTLSGSTVDTSGNVVATDGGQIVIVNDSNQQMSGIISFGSALGVWTRKGRYVVLGTDSTNYALFWIDAKGCIAKNSLVLCDEYAVWLSDDGLYATSYNGGFSAQKLSGEIDYVIDTFNATSGTGSGRAALESSFAWYADRAYNLYLPGTNIGVGFSAGTIWRFDFTSQGWTSYAPGFAASCACVLQTGLGLVETAYLGRSDGTHTIYAFDTHSLNQSISNAAYTPRPIRVNGVLDRTEVMKFVRVRQYGTGTLTSGSVYASVDGRQEGPYTAQVTFTAQGFLIEQEFTPAMTGRVCFPLFTGLTGINLILTACECDYEVVS